MARLGEQVVRGNQQIFGDQSIPPRDVIAGYHLDMTATSSYGDLSSNPISISEGDSILVAVRPTQIGTADHPWAPGIFAAETGGTYDDIFTFYSPDGVQTSSPASTQLIFEDNTGERATSVEFNISLTEPSVVGFAINDDLSVNWFHNDTTLAEDNTLDSFDGMSLEYIGVGYASATDDGYGHKYMDDLLYYDRTVDPSEVSTFHSSGTPPDSPAAHYAMDEGEGSTTVDAEGAYADASLTDTEWVEGDLF